MDEIRDLISERLTLKRQVLDIEHRLTDMAVHYDGTLKDALKSRLVKLNFPAPPGFHKWIDSE